MPRAMRPRTHDYEWTLVSARHPCPVCAGTAACRRENDGDYASCATLPSEWRLTNGGWLHRTNDARKMVSGVSLSAVSSNAQLRKVADGS